MQAYDDMLDRADKLGLEVSERPLSPRTKGLYVDGYIWIRKHETLKGKLCILAEELGHHATSVGHITDVTQIENARQELRARQWAHQLLIPLDRIIEAHHARISGRFELAAWLGVTEAFLQETLDRYADKYGLSVQHKGYTILFDPLGVIEPLR